MTSAAGPGQTRNELLAHAVELFSAHGYAGTSLDEVVAAANVTKGALYHHFAGKQALFEAVFESVQREAVQEITVAVSTADDPWDRAAIGVRTFVGICQQPQFRRIVMQEGPVALGFDRFREADDRSTFGLVRDIVSGVLEPYDVPPGVVSAFTRVFYGALTAAGLSVAAAAHPEAAGRDVETVFTLMLEGLRQRATD